MTQLTIDDVQVTNKKPSQAKRMIEVLRRAGKYGVTQNQFYNMGIRRAASRVSELKKQGYNIITAEVKPEARYVYLPEGQSYED